MKKIAVLGVAALMVGCSSKMDMSAFDMDSPAQLSANEINAVESDALLAKRVYNFGFDRFSVINAEDKEALEAHAKYLQANPQAIARIEGHTDERGAPEYNVGLGERRANAVKNVLTSFGVAPERVSIVSFGQSKPLDPAQTTEAHAKNRRAELIYEVVEAGQEAS